MSEPIIITQAQLEALRDLVEHFDQAAQSATVMRDTLRLQNQKAASANAEGLRVAYRDAHKRLAAIVGEHPTAQEASEG